jgi:putative endonuclease
MPAWVYILQSATTGRHYCGQTDALEKRIQQHNDPHNTFARTTKVFAGPWQLIWSKDLETRTEALRLEKRIKKRGIARFLQDLTGGC